MQSFLNKHIKMNKLFKIFNINKSVKFIFLINYINIELIYYTTLNIISVNKGLYYGKYRKI